MVFHCLNMMWMPTINPGSFQVPRSLYSTSFYIFSFLIGADVTDYFNYGFTEETWKLYCERQRQMKSEVGHLNKTVSSSTSTHLLVGQCTYSHSSRQLVPSYNYNNIIISYFAFIAVLNHINFNISINNNYCKLSRALFRIVIIMHYMIK